MIVVGSLQAKYKGRKIVLVNKIGISQQYKKLSGGIEARDQMLSSNMHFNAAQAPVSGIAETADTRLLMALPTAHADRRVRVEDRKKQRDFSGTCVIERWRTQSGTMQRPTPVPGDVSRATTEDGPN